MTELPEIDPVEDAEPAKLQIRVQNAHGPAVVRLTGEIDLSNAARLQDQLSLLVEQGHVVVDLSEVTFIDSTGLTAFIVGHRRAAAAGTGLHLAGASGTVQRLLELTQLDRHLDHHEALAGALQAAGASDAAGQAG
ncbi:MAG TPA: STAS domain-containing protein [Jiangellaceae bacterium]|jgi:anti-anti-sigma factor|nr:STAS domain-containing protein [Jiangellaceae bacterium]